jgi:hypothetical protein
MNSCAETHDYNIAQEFTKLGVRFVGIENTPESLK